MTEKQKKEKKQCGGNKRAMIAYGVIQLGVGVISALSLGVIALNFVYVNQESKLLVTCIEEEKERGKSTSASYHFCNGGK